MTNEEVLKERERIREIIKRKIEALIKFRLENISHKKLRYIGMLEKLEDDLLFLIDNPDYKRKTNTNSGS